MVLALTKTFFLAVTLTLLYSFNFGDAEGWGKAGSKPKSYEMGVDKHSGPDGKNAGTIKSIDRKIEGFGTLMQTSSSCNYNGKRLRMTALIKSESVQNWAGLWFRVDMANGKQSIALDNMHNRAVKGTTPWTKYELVLDIPRNAGPISYGALLNGTGQIWFTDIKFDVVNETIPVTAEAKEQTTMTQSEPSNLDFEK